MLDSLTEKHTQLQRLRPLDAAALRLLEEKVVGAFEMEVIATSIQIEGNSLTLRETQLVIEKGITISGKPLKDHLEALNLKYALDFIKSIATSLTPLTEREVREIHSLVMNRIDHQDAGRYRTMPVRISGCEFMPPAPLHLPELMLEWQEKMTASQALHPVLQAADAHETFVTIHPFADGNGRTARLIMNLTLLRHGYPCIIIPSEINARLAYYQALEDVQSNKNPEAFRTFIIAQTHHTIDRYIALLS